MHILPVTQPPPLMMPRPAGRDFGKHNSPGKWDWDTFQNIQSIFQWKMGKKTQWGLKLWCTIAWHTPQTNTLVNNKSSKSLIEPFEKRVWTLLVPHSQKNWKTSENTARSLSEICSLKFWVNYHILFDAAVFRTAMGLSQQHEI